MDRGNVFVDKLRRETKYYKNKNPSLAELLDFYLAIFEVQQKYIPEVEPQLEIDEEQAQKDLEDGRCVLKSKDIFIDPRLFREVVEELCKVVTRKARYKGRLDRLLSDSCFQPENISNFVERLKRDDITYLSQLSDRIEISREILFFLIHCVLTLFYQRNSEEVRERIDYSQWFREFCPICGHKPQVSKLREEEGLRLLQCSLCRTQWSFPRIKCPFCGNTDQETLQYFYPVEDKGHRVDVCDACKKYIKTSDERILGREVVPQVEDVATVHLDMVAKERGYTPGTQYMADLLQK